MKITIIGSADAFNAAGRGNSCYLVESPGAGKLMIDFGPTALGGLRRLGIAPSSIDALVFTHLHGDHAAGFPFLVIDALFNDVRTTNLEVLGPVLTRSTLDALLSATYGDIAEHSKRLSLTIDEFLPGDERRVAGYGVRAFAADHMKPPHRPLCVRVQDSDGKIAAFSGDTRICPGLFDAAAGADVLVAECTRLAHPAGDHCTWEEWRVAAGQLSTKALVLSHLGADVREKLGDLSLPPSSDGGELALSFADDGRVIEL